jgi:hypothetical protein
LALSPALVSTGPKEKIAVVTLDDYLHYKEEVFAEVWFARCRQWSHGDRERDASPREISPRLSPAAAGQEVAK